MRLRRVRERRTSGYTPVALAELSLLMLIALHALDHELNQPARELPDGTRPLALAGFMLVAAALALALRRSPLAGPAAIVSGLASAIVLLTIHVAGLGPLADPYRDFGANALSWLALLITMLAAPLLAYLGYAAWRAEGTAARDLSNGSRRTAERV